MATRPIYFDCDTGIDDAVALAYLMAAPEVELVGVGTVSGNVDAEQAAVNTLDVLALGGAHQVPVAIGGMRPLAGPYGGGAPSIHGRNGLGDVELPHTDASPAAESAAEMLVRLARQHAGKLEVIAVGPLTNLALALQLDPSIAAAVRTLTIMGGAALVPGNRSPVAEANIWSDPEAAAAALSAPWQVTLVPLDVTLEHVFVEEDRQALAASSVKLNRALAEMLESRFEFYASESGPRGCPLHDPLAVAVALDHVRATRATEALFVVDTTSGPGRGQTICDLRGRRNGRHNIAGAYVRVILETDRPFAALRDRLLSLRV